MAKASINEKVEGSTLQLFTSPTKRNRSDLEERDDKKTSASSIFLDQPAPQEVTLKCDREVTLPVLDASVPMPEMSMTELFGADATEKSHNDPNDSKHFPDVPSPSEPEPKKKHKKDEEPTQKMTPGQIAEFFKQPVPPPTVTPEKASCPWDIAPPSSSAACGASKPKKSTSDDVGEEPIEQSVFLDMPTPKNDPPTPDPKACLPIPNAELKTPIALKDLFGEETLQSPSLPKRRRGIELGEHSEGFDREFSSEAAATKDIVKTKRKKSDEKDKSPSKAGADETEIPPKPQSTSSKSKPTSEENHTTDPGENPATDDAVVELLSTDTQKECKPAPPPPPQQKTETVDETSLEGDSAVPKTSSTTNTHPVTTHTEEPMPAE